MFDIFYFHNPSNLFAFEQKVNSVEQAQELSRTRYLWIVDGLNDYSDFDFHWEPAPWEADQVHIWPSQHQENGGTYLIPKTQTEHQNRDHHSLERIRSVPRLHIKHNPTNTDDGDVNTRYISDYLGTMRRALSKTDWEYCWVTSDVCDYPEFDFTWHPSEWQQDMLHVFASNEQKFGDTFYVHIPSFLKKTENLKVLEWFETLHFVEDVKVIRPLPEYVKYDSDTVVPAVWKHEFVNPLAVFYRHDLVWAPTVSLWQERTKTVVPLIEGAETVLVPRETKNYLKTQIYDYPWINKKYSNKLRSRNPMDIVFISYDEPNADKNFEILKNKFCNAKRLHGVNGMVTALKEAAKLSKTDYFYAVFAKTKIHENFNFTFHPDYLKEACHYLFHGRNMSNGLEYGTLGVTMYNCRLVIEAETWDVDFTTSFPVEVVPILSAYGHFATDPLRAWRTAFRECTKLQSKCIKNQIDIETDYRLKVWTSYAEGDNSDWVLKGAKDGVDYANSGKNIMLINDWNWLLEYFNSKYL